MENTQRREILSVSKKGLLICDLVEGKKIDLCSGEELTTRTVSSEYYQEIVDSGGIIQFLK